MIWGGGAITTYGSGILLPVEGNINLKKYCQILHYGLLPVLDWFYPEGDYFLFKTMYQFIRLAETRECVEDRHINASEWPPQSPNLNIIENVWQIMQVKLCEDACSIRTRAELVQRLQLLWRDITVDKLQ